jgi:hypothetical protein
MVALLLLAVWPAVSSHAVLQHSGLIHQFHDDHDEDADEPGGSHEHHANGHDVADGQCVLSAKEVSVPTHHADVMPFVVWWLAAASMPELSPERHPSGLAPPGLAPPELSHRWQFFFRAALPARAPSFVS